MTRINVGVPPRELTGKHLIAEHREIKRIPNSLYKARLDLPIPAKFKLGEGHVRFFYDKGRYLHDRYNALYVECRRRGYRVTNWEAVFDVYDKYPELYNDYEPTEDDVELVRERINERLNKHKDENI